MHAMLGVIKDPNSSEAWFDAEEELGSPNQDGKMEKLNERKESMDYKMEQNIKPLLYKRKSMAVKLKYCSLRKHLIAVG